MFVVTSSHYRRSPGGFTLLEVLIAISVTALIGLGSWQLLNSAIRTYELGQENLQALSALQRAQLVLERDFSQIVPRAIRDEFGDYQAAVMEGEDFYTVELTRAGWRNPLQQKRSELQRVAYELNDGQLLRHHWKVLDRAQDSEPVTRRLLEDVERFEIAYLNDSDAWLDAWPPLETNTDTKSQDKLLRYAQLPKAVRIELEHPRYGVITRYFEQPKYIESTLMQASGGQDGSGQADDQTQDQNQGGGGQTNGQTGGQSGNQNTQGAENNTGFNQSQNVTETGGG